MVSDMEFEPGDPGSIPSFDQKLPMFTLGKSANTVAYFQEWLHLSPCKQ